MTSFNKAMPDSKMTIAKPEPVTRVKAKTIVSEPVHYKLLQSIATTRNKQRWGLQTLAKVT